jgi:uncharacterized protein (TIGR03083 family)
VNSLDVLRYGQRTIMSVVRQFGPDDWSRPNALGVWTARDLVGHLGAFEVRFAEALAPFVGEAAGTRLLAADTETFNDDQAAIRSDWSVADVLTELETAHALVMKRARAIPPERWREPGTIPWYGAEYSLDDLVVYQQYGHKREHEPQLGAVLERRPAG